MLRNVVRISLASIALAGPAAASDMTSPPLASSTFTGWRLGVNAGYSFGELGDMKAGSAAFPLLAPLAPTTPNDIDLDGFVGGVSLGYSHAFGKLVVGIEGDIEASDVDGSAIVTDAYNAPPDPSEASFDGNYTASIRLMLGYKVSDVTLLYATGGYEVFNVDVRVENLGGNNTPIATYDETFSGYTIGGGFEHILGNAWSVRAEYRYSDYDTETKVLPNFADTKISGDIALHTFRAGLGYRF